MSDADDNTSPAAGRLKGFSIVSSLTVVSRITGLARDMLMASLFGTGWVLDTFTVAFRIPGLFRRLFGEGAMTAAFLPRFVDEDARHGRAAASAMFAAVARQLVLRLGSIVLIVELLLCGALALADLSERTYLLVELTTLMLPYALVICLAALHCAALNAVHHFLIPAMLPIVFNLVWLSCGLPAMGLLATEAARVRSVALSVVAGGFLQLFIAARTSRQYGIRNVKSQTEKKLRRQVAIVFRQMGPILLGLSVMQLNATIDSLLAWLLAFPDGDVPSWLERFRLTEGTASALYFGQRLFQFPLGVFGIALGTVLFPRFTRHAQAGSGKELSRDILHGLQLVLVVGLPASAGLWLISEPITDLLFRRGAFGSEDARLTSKMIGAYGIGVWVYCGLLIVNRVFYAIGDQRIPVRQGLICVGLNIVLNIALLPFLKEIALPVASILATLFQLCLALGMLRRRVPEPIGRGSLAVVLWKSTAGTLVMAAACLAIRRFLDNEADSVGGLVRTAVPVFACVVVYGGTLRVLGLSPQRLLAEPIDRSR